MQISTHASLAGGDMALFDQKNFNGISTHASLAGGDIKRDRRIKSSDYFNPRLPRGRRLILWGIAVLTQRISTHASLAGGDGGCRGHADVILLISTHASLAGGDSISLRYAATDHDFNPRLPRGRRQSVRRRCNCDFGFQPTPPSREATVVTNFDITDDNISTHASLAGGDLCQLPLRAIT